MTAEARNSVLRQMAQARAPAAPDVPLTASRAVRLALTRSSEKSVGLKLAVISVSEDMLTLDSLMAALADNLLMVGLKYRRSPVGLIACDFQFAAAAVEVQTIGQVAANIPDARAITGTDMSLTEPVFQGFLNELDQTTPGTALNGWVGGATLTERFDAVRQVGFELADVTYRLMRLSVDLGGNGRTAVLMLALPLQNAPVAAIKQEKPLLPWSPRFQAAVKKAPARLDAVLHQFRMPLRVATNLEVGQVIPLPGCTVGSVRLVAPGGHTVAHGRLGQIAGQMAVRLQAAADQPAADMSHFDASAGFGNGAGLMMIDDDDDDDDDETYSPGDMPMMGMMDVPEDEDDDDSFAAPAMMMDPAMMLAEDD